MMFSAAGVWSAGRDLQEAVVTFEEMTRFTRARPFLPYRVHLADGRVYDLLYPHTVILTPHVACLGILDAAGEHIAEMPSVPLDDIIKVERLEPQVMPGCV